MNKTDTPSNIQELDYDVIVNAKGLKELKGKETILDYVHDENYLGKNSPLHPAIRVKQVNYIFKEILGLDVSPDYMLAAITKSHATLVTAPAGAGKSTLAHGIIALLKLFENPRVERVSDIKFRHKKVKGYSEEIKTLGDNILSIVYNKENIKDINARQYRVANAINSKKIDDFPYLDSKLNAKTFHSICRTWVLTNLDILKIKVKIENLDSGSRTRTMITAISQALTRLGIDKLKEYYSDYDIGKMLRLNDTNIKKHVVSVDMAKKLLDLNAILVETLRYDDVVSATATTEEVHEILSQYTEFYAIELPVDFIVVALQRFYFSKRMKSALDFEDYLYFAHKLLTDEGNNIDHIIKSIDFIVADEAQDYTPIMWEILLKLSKSGIPSFIIGDDDQSIYRFRGVNLHYILNFKEIFPNANVYSLQNNRRCRQRIQDEANYFINQVSNRINKDILAMKPDGVVNYVPYKDHTDQIMQIIGKVSSYEGNTSGLSISARDNFYVEYIASMLELAGIPYRVFGETYGYKPMFTQVHKLLNSIVRIMYNPYSPEERINMYMVTPLKKEEWHEIIHYKAEKREFEKGFDGNVHFANLDYSSYASRKGLIEIIKMMEKVSNNINETPMKEYMPELIKNFKDYHWDFVSGKADMKDILLEDYTTKQKVAIVMETLAFNDFVSDMTYREYVDHVAKVRDKYESNVKHEVGVAVSTFHKLKGLEFDETIVTFMESNIFPNYDILLAKGATPEVLQAEMDTDLRLWYVVLTRAIDKINIFYNENDVSGFVAQRLGNKHNYASNSLDTFSSPNKEFIDPYEMYISQMEEEINTVSESSRSDEELMKVLYAEPVYLDITSDIEIKEIDLDEDVSNFLKTSEVITLDTEHKLMEIEENETNSLQYSENGINSTESNDIRLNSMEFGEILPKVSIPSVIGSKLSESSEITQSSDNAVEEPSQPKSGIAPNFGKGGYMAHMLKKMRGDET